MMMERRRRRTMGREREGGRNTNSEGGKEESGWLERGREEGETPTVTLAILGP